MKKVIIIALFAIFMAIFATFVVYGDKGDKQNKGYIETNLDDALLHVGYKGDETDAGEFLEIKESEGKRWNKTKEHKFNETDDDLDDENGVGDMEINETDHGKRGFPPGLNQSISRGRPSNVSIEVRIRNIERIGAKFQEIKTNATEKPGLGIGQYVQNLEDISGLMENKSVGMRVSEIARNISKSLEKSKKAEEQIKGRGFIMRFIFGGDKNSAREVYSEISSNQRMIEELRDIENESDDDARQLLRQTIHPL